MSRLVITIAVSVSLAVIFAYSFLRRNSVPGDDGRPQTQVSKNYDRERKEAQVALVNGQVIVFDISGEIFGLELISAKKHQIKSWHHRNGVREPADIRMEPHALKINGREVLRKAPEMDKLYLSFDGSWSGVRYKILGGFPGDREIPGLSDFVTLWETRSDVEFRKEQDARIKVEMEKLLR